MLVEGNNVSKENSSHTYNKKSDFLFITRASYLEKDIETLIEKEWYMGYIAIFNLIIINETHNIHEIFDEKINDYLSKEKISLNNSNEYYPNNESNFCFAKIEFYHNGEIKNIYLPKGFLLGHYSYIEEYAKLLLPRISSDLYVENIEDELNKLQAEENDNNDNIQDSNEYFSDNKINLRNLNSKYKKRKKYFNNIYIGRSLSEEEEENNTIIYLNNSNISYEHEDFLTPPLSKPINYEFRQASIINDSIYDLISDNFSENSEFINDNIYSNLTECSIKSIETDEVTMEGSASNTTIYSLIDDEGYLKTVYEKSTHLMMAPEEDNNEEENDEDLNNLYSQIYDNNNQISLDQAKEADKDNEVQKNNISFGLSYFSINSSSIINCTDHFIDEKINEKLYHYFDSFDYDLYNYSMINNNTINDLHSFEEINNNSRYLSEEGNNDNSYYGMNRIIYMKQLYKYNLIGMKMEGQMYSEIDPSTGKLSVYTLMKFGNKNSKIKVQDQISNAHIILERSNQMGYNFIQLLNQTNNELIERSENYSEIIIEFEKNFTSFFENYTDYSGLFKDTLDNMYKQVQNFSGEFFYKLIDLINRVHYNFTIILEDIKIGEYDFVNKIRNITKNEYIKYIYDMINILENFENKTLTFLNDLEDELINIDDFQIDILYDIIDIIYESKQIFKKFNRNLFKSIEKGILTFKCDISDHIDNIIGELLNTTDFLAVNINKNEILIKAIDEETRKNATVKLKEFRDIIITIMEIINKNINDDYENEMNIENNESIKYISNKKAEEFLSNVENRSDETIKKIKANINNFNIYESYSDNLDILNNINNKTIIEYINDIYKNVIYQALNITPQYLNETSGISNNKKLLLQLSKNITNKINDEIQEINEYIFSYTNQYLEKNIYNIHYNLYYFRKNFLDKEMSKLLKEFYLLLNRTIKVHFKEMIDYNFELANQVFREEDEYFDEYSWKRRRFLTSDFVERYYQYKAKFEEYFYLISSEDFLNILEKYFYKIKNDILDFIKNKLFSIKIYYFDFEHYNKAFYFHEQINNEILNIIDNINNYYNEMNMDGDIKIKALNLVQEILKPYHDKKIEELDKFYEHLYDRTTNYHVREDEKDFVYSYWRFFKGWKNIYLYTEHHKNINYVLKDLKKTNNFISSEINIIYSNFIQKFDKYLTNYISYVQNLYNYLYKYVENKINKSSTNKLISNYLNKYNETITKESNFGLLSKINDQMKNIKDDINIYINKFYDNIQLLKEKYYNLSYLPNFSIFLEYPNEIIYKINQFYNESIFNIDSIKSTINYIYKKRIKYIIKSTNLYINNFMKSHINYIKININSSYIIHNYSSAKLTEIDNLYNNCITKSNILKVNDNDILFLDKGSYDDKMLKNKNYIKDFVLFLEKEINNSFIYEICDNNTGPFYNETICHKEKKEFNSSFSKYNFNILKLRTGIYYSKTLLENIDTLFDEYNFHKIINSEKIQLYDEFINDKNIIDIYNKTNYKIVLLDKESDILINDTYEYFLEDFKKQYSFKNEYLTFSKIMKEILEFKEINFIGFVSDTMKEIKEGIISLMNEFNQTLYYQLSIRENYTYYNYNNTYFNNIYNSYKMLIKNTFSQTRTNISNLKNSYIFNNSMKTLLSKLQSEKRKYIKNTINNFCQYNKEYNFNLLNKRYNLGEKIENVLEKEYIDYEFTFIYDYVELFENNIQTYINRIIEYANNLEKYYFNIYESIYTNFNNELKKDASSFINIDFIKNLKYNQSKCENYINYTESDYSDDLYKDEQFQNITNNIDYVFNSCLNYSSENYTINITLSEKIYNIINESNNCSDFITNLKNNIYYKETLKMIDCFINNYYIKNYSFIYFYNFSDTIGENLENTIIKMNKFLIKKRMDENFLFEFFEKQNYSLIPYDINLLDIEYDFEDISDMINYANQIKKNEYKNYLNNSLITSFRKSYRDFVNNFILDEIIDDIIITINNRLEVHLDYLTRKILDEYNYYLFLLNTTDELGETSKKALVNLYEKIKVDLNETVFYLFEDDINFYLDLFYRENKKMFRNNFLNYYFRNLNEYNMRICKIAEFEDEFILDIKFNKTLDEISNNLMKDMIINKVKEYINDSIYSKIQNLYNITNNLKINLKNILDKKKTRYLPLNMNRINQIIINYTYLVNNQNNRYYLNISNEPFKILDIFINEYIKPPLYLIKTEYNTIEDRLLKELIEIINSFPNFYLQLKDTLDLEMMNKNITPFIVYSNNTIFDYIEILENDIKSYINKLIHYTYINGLYYQESPCAYSFCFNESDIFANYTVDYDDNDFIRRLQEKGKKFSLFLNGLFKIPNLDKEKINKLKNKKLRNLEQFDSSAGSISESDIQSYLLDMQSILSSFYEYYLDQEYRDINRFSKIFFDKINNTYLIRLKRSIDVVGVKFKTFFTEMSYNKFQKKLFEQYDNIVIYIHNYSDILEYTKNSFINTLNSSSIIIDTMFNISSMKINSYYKLFYQLIQDKLKYINEEDAEIPNNIKRMLSKKKEGTEKDEGEEEEGEIPEQEEIKIKYNKDEVLTFNEKEKFVSFINS